MMAVLASLVGFCHLVEGFRIRQLAPTNGCLLDAPYTTRQATYDLRRLKRKGAQHSKHLTAIATS